ncbi:MAG: helix-hairpin-helix domain-containing protein [Bacteroidales bacterium]|nr:helix-hairpin-helix domain-containing protein [Bacteroidales bacterium]
MKEWKSFFECSSTERRGLIVLSVLIILLLGARVTLVFMPPKPLPPLDAEEYRQYLAFEERQKFLADSIEAVWAGRRQSYTKRYNNSRPFRHGSGQHNRTWEHWEAASSTADSIRDFTRKYPEKRSLTAEKVELNRADTLMLRTIPGIGARTAREIISYRERLGGFTDMGQLLEIRIIDSARWRQITPYLSIDTTGALHKLRINHASVNELVKHPYIDYYLAKTIVVWRDNKGRFRSLDEMRSATRVYPELYNRLKPYLTTQ